MAARVTIDSDTFWHLAAGRWIWQQGQILDHDVFSLTRLGQPWVYPGWLAELVMFGFHQAFGLFGLNMYTLLAVLGAFWLVWRGMSQPELLRGFVVLMAAAASAIFWSARPQMITLVFSAVFLVAMESERQQTAGWRLWLLPLAMAVWANSHGGFIAGHLTVLAYFGGALLQLLLNRLLGEQSWSEAWRLHGTRLKRLTLLLLLLVVVVALNPFGPRMIFYPFQTLSLGTLSNYIQEWQSPNFHQANTWPFAAMLLLAAVAMALSERSKRPHELLLYLGFGALALHSARNIALFAIGTSLLTARHLDSALKPLVEKIGAGRQVPLELADRLNIAAAILLGLALLLWGWPRISSPASLRAIQAEFPAEATDYLLEQGGQPAVFHTYRFGGYLIWRGFPQLRSFVDGRTDLFGDELLSQYLATYLAEPGFIERLAEWNIEWVLVEPDSPLAAAARSMDWPNPVESPSGNLYQVR